MHYAEIDCELDEERTVSLCIAYTWQGAGRSVGIARPWPLVESVEIDGVWLNELDMPDADIKRIEAAVADFEQTVER